MLRIVLWGVAGLMWGMGSFLAGLYLTFPEEKARDYVAYEFYQRTDEDYTLDASSLSLWWLSGVKMDDVTIYEVKQARRGRMVDDEEEGASSEGERIPYMHFDVFGVRLSLPHLLLGQQALAFLVETCGGEIKGSYADSSGETSVSLSIEDLDLGQASDSIVGGLLKGMGFRSAAETAGEWLKVLGTVEASLTIELNTEDVKESTGSFSFQINGLTLTPGTQMAAFDVPEAKFTKAILSMEVKEGKFEVTEGAFESETVNATISGDITLNKQLRRSRNRLEVSFSFSEDLDSRAQMLPDLKRARDNEGKYNALLTGTIVSPNFRLSRSSPATSRLNRSGSDGPVVSDRTPLATRDDGLTDEERRKQREERIKERRERLKKRREERAKQTGVEEEGGDRPIREPLDIGGPPGMNDPMEDLPPPGEFEDPLLPDIPPPPGMDEEFIEE